MRRIYPMIRNYAINSTVTPIKEWKSDKWNRISFDELKEQFATYFSKADYSVKDGYIETDDKDLDRYLDCYDNTMLVDGKWRSGFDKQGNLL